MSRHSKNQEHTDLNLTKHASRRLSFRGIRSVQISRVIRYGRSVFAKGAEIFVMGRKEIVACARLNIDAEDLHGIHVICGVDTGAVITAYRNKNLRGLRPRRRGRRDHPQAKHIRKTHS